MLTKIGSQMLQTTQVTAGSYTNSNITVNESGQITSASSGTGASTDVPKISNLQVTNSSWTVLDDTAVDVVGGYVLLTGVNFVTGCLVYIGTTPANSVAFVSSTTVRVTLPAITAGTYPVYLVNPDGGVAIRVPGVTISASPSWQTASSLADQYDATAISLQLLATDAASYSITSGSLPPGLTMNSSGLITGTVTGVAVDTTYTFTVVAVDAQNQDSPRTFTVTITVSDPYFKLTTLLLTGNSGNNIVTDASTNNFPITVVGDSRASNFSPYLTGWSNYFDGTGDYLDIATNAAFDFGTGDFTIECWAYLTTASNASSALITCMNVAGANPSWLLGFSNTANQMAFLPSYFTVGVGFTYTSYYNTWTHIAVSRSGTNLRLFANGTLVSTATDSTTISTGGKSIRIGSRYQNDSQYLINGYISNLRIVKGTALYTANFTPATTTLTAVAGTSLLTCHANRLVDSSTNNFAITKSGDVRVDSFNPFGLTNSGTTGSMYFDGTGDYATIANHTGFDFGSSNFTIEVWAYFTSFTSTNGNVVVSKGTVNSVGTDFYSLQANSAGVIQFYFGNSTPILAGSTLLVNRWYHLAVTRSGNNFTLWVDGSSSTTTTSSTTLSAGGPLIVGSQSYSPGAADRSTYGYISNLHIIKNTAIYTSSFTPPTAPLTAVANTQLLTLQNRQPPNNHTFQDSSTNNHLITRSGNTTQGTFSPFSQTGWSNYFSGSSQYLSISSPPTNLREWWTTDFTIEAWIYPLNATNLQNTNVAPTMCGNCDTAGYDYWSFGPINSGIVRFKYYNGSTVNVDSIQTITINQWNHVAMTKTSSGITIFVNGVANSTTAVSGTPQASVTVPFTIGANYTTSINAHISNLRAVKGRAVYTSNFTPSTSPLTRTTGGTNPPQGTECSLLTCQSNRFLDSNGVNTPASSPLAITPNGSPSIQAFSPFAPTAVYSPVVHGGSAYFDGTGDYITVPNNTAFDMTGTSYCFEAWIYCIESGELSIFNRFDGQGGPGLSIQRLSSASGRIISFYTGTQLSGTTAILEYTWYHIVCNFDGTTKRIFINGILDASTTSGTMWQNSSTNTNMDIGRRTGDARDFDFAGYMSSVRITKSTAVYTSNFTPPTAPVTNITNTSLLLNFTNDAIEDATGRNVIETVADARTTSVVSKWAGQTSMLFDGTGDYLKIQDTDLLEFGSGNWTVDGWFYLTVATDGVLYGRDTNSGADFFIRVTYVSSTPRLGVYLTSNGSSFAVSNTDAITGAAISLNTWTHFAVTSNNGTIQKFINGTGLQIATGITSIYNSSNTWYVGVRGNLGEGFNGYIQDLRITRGHARYTSNFTPPTASLRLK